MVHMYFYENDFQSENEKKCCKIEIHFQNQNDNELKNETKNDFQNENLIDFENGNEFSKWKRKWFVKWILNKWNSLSK